MPDSIQINREKRWARAGMINWDNTPFTVRDYDFLNIEQGGICEICGSTGRDKHKKLLVPDHDHDTGVVRGLLCIGCNLAVGTCETMGFGVIDDYLREKEKLNAKNRRIKNNGPVYLPWPSTL